jgi:SAM-dependent methyltransferase
MRENRYGTMKLGNQFRQHVYLPIKYVVRKLYYYRGLRRLIYLPEELLDKTLGRRDPLIPPKWMILIGPGDFTAIGNEFLRYFTELGGLKPSHSVLDVGCGIGRMAIPLTRFLNEQGSYEGFDIVPDGIAWCQRQITSRFPRFQFTLADIYNGVYNPQGHQKASKYVFPMADASFDFLTSVFTHMMPADMENYLRQIVRALKPGGRCFITYFLISPEVEALLKASASTLPMREQPGGYSTIDRGTREYDIAFPESAVLALCGKLGFELTSPVQYGTWCGRTSGLTYQDFLVARKPALGDCHSATR